MLRTALLIAVICVVPPGWARADSWPITITDARFGYPAARGNGEYLFKPATWVPVWLDLEVREPDGVRDVEIQVSTPDGDDLISSARLKMPLLKSGRLTAPVPYLKPGSLNGDLTVRIVDAHGKPLAASFSVRQSGRPASRYFILSAGAPLPSLRLSRVEGQSAETMTDADPLRNGWVEHLSVTNVEQLPDRWFGYQSIDLLILTTGDRAFWAAFENDLPRKTALRQWIERGGRAIVSAGADSPALRHFLPATIHYDAVTVPEVPMLLPSAPRLSLKRFDNQPIPVIAFVVPPVTAQVKLTSDEIDKALPLVVQVSRGLGHITFVAFDLDQPAMMEWKQRDLFWNWLLNEAGTRLPTGNDSLAQEEGDRYLPRFQTNLEFFEGVPVISFGWVALLILGYILLVGPLEYLILKRLLKRLELTWLTLPIIVVGVCATAYLAAVELKGRQLRINKVDLVDIDVRDKQVHGRSWFTLFSPRTRNYTIGVEPAWVADSPADMLVSWHGKARHTRQSLLRRQYEFHIDEARDIYADGLEKVPIQIWSTKSFTAQWAGSMTKPLVESTLRISAADPNQITGSITSRLPIELIADAQLLYRDRVTPLPPLVRDIPRFVSTSSFAAPALSFFQQDTPQKDLVTPTRGSGGPPADFDLDPRFRLWPILFHEAIHGQFNRLSHASFRDLDQSRRVGEGNPYEAWIIARIPGQIGPAESLPQPTRLWLNALPGQGTRAPVDATLRQDTYLRILIPIAPTE